MPRPALVAGLAVALLAACGALPSPSAPASSLPSAPASSGSVTGSPPGSPAPFDPEPAPPATFDPAGLPVLTYVGEGGTIGVWLGPIGRPDLAVPLVPPAPEGTDAWGVGRHLGGGRVVVVFTPVARASVLRLLAANRPAVDLVDRAVDGTLAVAPAAGIVAVVRTTLQKDDRGVWAIPIDGGEPTVILPPQTGLAGDRSAVALAPDGRAVAASRCPFPAQVRFGDAAPTLIAPGIPIGFDRAGNLVASGDCDGGRPMIWRPGAERGEPLAPEAPGYRAVVTPGGRFLAAVNGERLAGQLLVRDLESGADRRFPLADGAWDPTTDTTDRYVVLRREDGEGVRFAQTWAVVDLVEGWVGYLPVDARAPG